MKKLYRRSIHFWKVIFSKDIFNKVNSILKREVIFGKCTHSETWGHFFYFFGKWRESETLQKMKKANKTPFVNRLSMRWWKVNTGQKNNGCPIWQKHLSAACSKTNYYELVNVTSLTSSDKQDFFLLLGVSGSVFGWPGLLQCGHLVHW